MHEVFEHTADLGLRARAGSLDELFAECARALFSVIVVNQNQVLPALERTYRIEGRQLDFLLFDWLSELLYTFESERLLLSDFQVSVTESGLRAVCRGEAMDSRRHRMDHEVKAVTYHGLKVVREGEGWMAEAILDI